MTHTSSAKPSWQIELEQMVSMLLSVAPPDAERHLQVRRIIDHEIRRRSQDNALCNLPRSAVDEIRHRCIYYAAQDLIAALAHKRVPRDAILREEAILYVQDRLQREGFRRIATFESGSGASIKTYLWQVIGRLLIDFLRSRRRRVDEDAALADDLPSMDPGQEAVASEQQIQEVLRTVFAEHGDQLERSRALHERLRERLRLTSHERLFLKAMFQHDLSIEEIRSLPGFEMTTSEAWRFYYRLLDRLMECFKQADALDALHATLERSEPTITLHIERQTVDIAARHIHYIEQRDASSSACEATYHGRIVRARIDQGFARLRKRLAPWFSAVNSSTLVADKWLAALGDRWLDDTLEKIEIPGISHAFSLGRSQRAMLQARYGAKKPDQGSYTNLGEAAMQTKLRARHP